IHGTASGRSSTGICVRTLTDRSRPAPRRNRRNHIAPSLLATVFAAASAVLQAAAPQARFTVERIPKTMAELKARFTAPQIDILEKLNRRDREHLIRQDPPVPGIVVPLMWEDEVAYTPFPSEWAAVVDHTKFIVVHQPVQAFAAYESGKLVRWGPVS